jgi:hypothetical protein
MGCEQDVNRMGLEQDGLALIQTLLLQTLLLQTLRKRSTTSWLSSEVGPLATMPPRCMA